MKIFKKILSTFFYSCFPNKSNNLYSNSNSISSSFAGVNNSSQRLEDNPLINIETKPINTMGLNNSPTINKDFLLGDGFDSIFLINKPSTYSSILESFINLNGPNSSQVKSLINPFMDLADRAYNVHLITGSDVVPVLHTLKSKSYLSKIPSLEANSSTSILNSTSFFEEETTSIDLSMEGVDRILDDYSVGVKIAMDLFS
jgi:hypothetical protein